MIGLKDNYFITTFFGLRISGLGKKKLIIGVVFKQYSKIAMFRNSVLKMEKKCNKNVSKHLLENDC
jgi:hypothetical protein